MNGFTLIETVVTITLIAVLTTMVAVSWSALRQQQTITVTLQSVRALLAEAKQEMLAGERAPACLSQAVSATDQELCSKIGIAFEGTQAIIFADTNDNNRFDEATDFIVQREALPAGAVAPATWQSWIFASTPPTFILYGPDGKSLSPTAPSSLQVTFSAGQVKTFTVDSYGHVDIANS